MSLKTSAIASSILAAVIPAHSQAALTIYTDEALFLSRYSNPTETIFFTRLKDGTNFDRESTSFSPLVHVTSSPPLRFAIRDHGWSDNVSIGSNGGPGSSSGWSTSVWDGESIQPANSLYPYEPAMQRYDSLYFDFGRTPTIAALHTTAGFRGFVPDGPEDNMFNLPTNAGATSLSFGFSPVAVVPEPRQGVLLLTGLVAVAGLAGRQRRAKRSAGRDAVAA